MKKYVVLALALGGLGNKVFNAGDIVSEDNFPAGNAQKLVEGGFIKEAEEAKEEKPKKDK